MVDIKSEGKSVPLETLQYIHEHKTGALLESCVVCGAILGEQEGDAAGNRGHTALGAPHAFPWADVCLPPCAGGAPDDDVERLRKYAHNIGLAFQVIDDILDVTQTSEQLGKTAGKDLLVEKTTYPKLFGLERSKEIADELIADAKAQLDKWGPKAAPLLALADYIVDRKN